MFILFEYLHPCIRFHHLYTVHILNIPHPAFAFCFFSTFNQTLPLRIIKSIHFRPSKVNFSSSFPEHVETFDDLSSFFFSRIIKSWSINRTLKATDDASLSIATIGVMSENHSYSPNSSNSSARRRADRIGVDSKHNNTINFLNSSISM